MGRLYLSDPPVEEEVDIIPLLRVLQVVLEVAVAVIMVREIREAVVIPEDILQ
jgi:hypothetical protein